jgi:hypothetical protein
VLMGGGETMLVEAQRYSGQGTPGVQTGFTQRSWTGETVSRLMSAAREVLPRTGCC